MKQENIKIIDVSSAFGRQSGTPRIIEFARGDWAIPSGGHLQGIQRKDDYFIISGSSDDEAYIIIVGKTSGGYKVVQKKIVGYEPFRHAGGIQIMGNYLVVGVEDNVKKDKSFVHFYDISEPEKPIGDPIITIPRAGREKLATAGAVAITKWRDIHLLIVGSWDSDTLDFYHSNGAELGKSCNFTCWQTWDKDSASRENWCDNVWGNYQNLNLICDLNNRLFLTGYYCKEEDKKTEDWVDLYSLDLSKPVSEAIKKVDSRLMKCKEQASFKYGGGVFIKSQHELISYACEAHCIEKTVINEFKKIKEES